MPDSSQFPAFQAAYCQDDAVLAAQLLDSAGLPEEAERRIDDMAGRMIGAIRAKPGGVGGIEEILREYSLSTKEGLALMVLAEALLRVPDAATADRLIEDKLGQGDFASHKPASDVALVNASAWALGLTARIIQPGETPEGLWARTAKRIGTPAVRMATRRAMQVMGNHFVLGQTIESALDKSHGPGRTRRRHTYDMLGEGARTAEDARRHAEAIHKAIEAIAGAAGDAPLPDRPGISVKLTALHPRFDALDRDRVMAELVPTVLELAQRARQHDLNFTIDAEEADRLELMLDVVTVVFSDPGLAGWDGFGLAIQSYLKRASAVIDYVAELARRLDRRVMLRLVKGAYWDAEVKRAQERGLDGYPVFTRKAMTDLNYLSCARRLLALRPLVFPQFATHNALTAATVLELAGETGGFEFQRLHGMGEPMYGVLQKARPEVGCRIYAPVGYHRDLLAYLVRRLLENGANSSFVSAAGDAAVPIERLLLRPQAIIGAPENASHPKLPLPVALFGPERRNSRGVEFGHRPDLARLLDDIERSRTRAEAGPIIDGIALDGPTRPVTSPIDGAEIGQMAEATPETVERAMAAARAGFETWNRTPADQRAKALDAAADLLEAQAPRFIALLQDEAGKTLDDALAEVREAVDFCRYYAAEGRRLFGDGRRMPGPAGESNMLRLRGRGVFATIAPWNFPLAIFLGQTAAALMAGNAVVAKPAGLTPLVGAAAVRLLHAAGIPGSALHLLTGNCGSRLVAHPDIAGVAFTGSTETAWAINRSLAAKNGPIVPLIAETGGINAMIVDATALPEQVSDDVITSAFRSAGQRCSALRLLCLQEDVADDMIRMIIGAARELHVGDPRRGSTQVGPVIDQSAKAQLEAHAATLKERGALLYEGTAPSTGSYMAPHVFALNHPSELTREVFGPILHIVRYRADGLAELCDAVSGLGYGLTLGVHSRIGEVVRTVLDRLPAGNVYVNRNMIGAVVGVQPFGGMGLSGTGPKAGGPHYLPRFGVEQTVTVNTAAAGGNAELMAQSE